MIVLNPDNVICALVLLALLLIAALIPNRFIKNSDRELAIYVICGAIFFVAVASGYSAWEQFQTMRGVK